VREERRVFYGKGARFVEVKGRDKEWRWTGERRWSALRQVKYWRQSYRSTKRMHDLKYEDGDRSGEYPRVVTKWPRVGVLACEIGEF